MITYYILHKHSWKNFTSESSTPIYQASQLWSRGDIPHCIKFNFCCYKFYNVRMKCDWFIVINLFNLNHKKKIIKSGKTYDILKPSSIYLGCIIITCIDNKKMRKWESCFSPLSHLSQSRKLFWQLLHTTVWSCMKLSTAAGYILSTRVKAL